MNPQGHHPPVGATSGIEELMTKVLELYQTGIESLTMRTSVPSGEMGKVGKYERSAHARIFDLQHSIKCISQIMQGDVENLTRQIKMRHDSLIQQNLVLDIHLEKAREHNKLLAAREYPNLAQMQLSTSVLEKHGSISLRNTAEPEEVLNEERSARQASSAKLNELNERLAAVTKQLSDAVDADTAKIEKFHALYKKIDAEILNKQT